MRERGDPLHAALAEQPAKVVKPFWNLVLVNPRALQSGVKGVHAMFSCPDDSLAIIIARLESMPEEQLSENQRWHIRDAVQALQIARDEFLLNPPICFDCDSSCKDLNQP